MKRYFLGLGVLLLFSQPAMSQVNCNLVETVGNVFNRVILNHINNEVAGTSHRINRRKSLKIKNVQNISFIGCKVKAKVNLTLKRKYRKNAHGYANLAAKVTSYDGRTLCINNSKITKIKLSHTLRLGEAVYKMVANKVLPNRSCFNL